MFSVDLQARDRFFKDRDAKRVEKVFYEVALLFQLIQSDSLNRRNPIDHFRLKGSEIRNYIYEFINYCRSLARSPTYSDGHIYWILYRKFVLENKFLLIWISRVYLFTSSFIQFRIESRTHTRLIIDVERISMTDSELVWSSRMETTVHWTLPVERTVFRPFVVQALVYFTLFST